MRKEYYAAALLLSCTLFMGCRQHTEATVSPVKVKVEKAEVLPIGGTQGFSGTVEEVNGSALSFSTGGTVKRILVSSGQRVAKGTLLAEVDATSVSNAHEAALAMRTQAEDAYGRMKQLHDNNSLPEIQWMEVQSKLKQAVAAEQIARKSLADCKLYAPFSGFISEKMVDMGQNVLPGMPVVKLVKIDRVKVKLAVPENEIATVSEGQPVEVQVSALGDRSYKGVVTEKGVAANALSRSYDVKVLIDNRDKSLLPGMICRATLSRTSGNVPGSVSGKEDQPAGIVLPNHVVQLDEHSRPFVWINAAGKARKRAVTTGELTNRGIVISGGLTAGDEVIVEGQQKVSENTQIEPMK